MSAGGLKLQAGAWSYARLLQLFSCIVMNVPESPSGNTVGGSRMLLELHVEGIVSAASSRARHSRALVVAICAQWATPVERTGGVGVCACARVRV
jgi:hypothetical protein